MDWDPRHPSGRDDPERPAGGRAEDPPSWDAPFEAELPGARGWPERPEVAGSPRRSEHDVAAERARAAGSPRGAEPDLPADRAHAADPRDDLFGRVQEGDAQAFTDLIAPGLARLGRLAAIATGERTVAAAAVHGAVRGTWRDLRAIRGPDALHVALERALPGAAAAAIRAWRPVAGPVAVAGPDVEQLDDAIAALRAPQRIALGRCLDQAPDHAAIAVAAGLGVEPPELRAGSPAGHVDDDARDIAEGTLHDLDGPLAGWDQARLRAALAARAARAMPPDLPAVVAGATADTLPDPRWRAIARSRLPPNRAILGTAGAAAALAIGIVVLAVGMSAPPAAPAPPGAAGGRQPALRVGPSGEPAPDMLAPNANFPSFAAGFRVQSVSEALSLVRSGQSADGRTPIAVAGWLSGLDVDRACASAASVAPPELPAPRATAPNSSSFDPRSVEGGFCTRTARLTAAVTPVAGGGLRAGGAHLHVRVLPGTALTALSTAQGVLAAADSAPVPVVVIGHFGDTRASGCDAGGGDCGEGFVVDRLAWQQGSPSGPSLLVRAGLRGAAPRQQPGVVDAIVDTAYPAPARVLSLVGVPAGQLGVVEPAATRLAAIRPGLTYAWLARVALPADETAAPGTDAPGSAPATAGAPASGPPTAPPALQLAWVLVDDADASIVGVVSGAPVASPLP